MSTLLMWFVHMRKSHDIFILFTFEPRAHALKIGQCVHARKHQLYYSRYWLANLCPRYFDGLCIWAEAWYIHFTNSRTSCACAEDWVVFTRKKNISYALLRSVFALDWQIYVHGTSMVRAYAQKTWYIHFTSSRTSCACAKDWVVCPP